MTKTLVKGSWYTVTTTTTCTVTDADGRTLGTAEAGRQFSFKATTENITFSDAAAVVQSENFDFAPAKLRMLGLLGGGSTNALPAGYLDAEFLESNGVSAVIDSQIVPDFETGLRVKMQVFDISNTYYFLGTQNGYSQPPFWLRSTGSNLGVEYYKRNNPMSITSLADKAFEVEINWMNSKIAKAENLTAQLAQAEEAPWKLHLSFFRATFLGNTGYDNGSQARFYYIKMSQGADIVRDMIPCISPDGVGCMYDKATKQPFKNAATGSFIVGMTLAQALKLSTLPATGGTLTVSLPWEAQLIASGIPAILQASAAKGWTITVQYRDPEADNAYYNKYAECVTVDDMKAVNADYKKDLTEDGEWIYPTPKMYDLPYWFSSAKNLKKFKGALPASRGGFNSFSSSNMTYFNCDMPSMQDGGFFLRGCPLSEYYGELSSMTVATNMFTGCVLDKASVIRISSYLQTFTSGFHPITLGIHVDHQTDEEVLAAIAAAEAKGWTVEVQWNGTATAQTASTFGLRKPPVYAKLGTVDRPDGTIEQVLNWGHYVTNADENGYQEFASVEEAKEYFNIGD